MPFTHKQMNVTFDLGTGDFGLSGANRVKLTAPLKASATIVENGGPSFATMDLAIYGMTLSNMNKLSTLGRKIAEVRRNTVTLEAGDTTKGLSVVYTGQITNAWSDFSAMPNVVFRVLSGGASLEAVTPIPPTSYRGLVDVSTVMRGLATQAKWTFEDGGVTTQLIDPYWPGTILDQMRRCAEAANINWVPGPPTLAIWPRGQARGSSIPVVSPTTGLIGYPSYTSNGIQLSIVHNPSINFGQKIKVESSLPAANGEWMILSLVHTLESETPGGRWDTMVTAVPEGIFASGMIPR